VTHRRTLLVFVLAGGLIGLLVTWLGSWLAGLVSALAAWLLGLTLAVYASARTGSPGDLSRRRFLTVAGLGGLAWAVVGPVLGRTIDRLQRPDAPAAQRSMAMRLGSEYMELVRRAYHPERSGELQLLLAPFNSSNYSQESLSLVPRDPRTSHASVWMYLQRIPLVAYGPGRIVPADSVERVSLADLAPTSARLMGFDGWPTDRQGRDLGVPAGGGTPPRVIVTFVIDGGGWNVLQAWPDRWPTLGQLMQDGANFRNAIVGSYPAVTASAHATIGTGTFPNDHGITGHNIRDGVPRKAYREAGRADPSDILVPTLADLWSAETDNRAWVGELGYQVWHLGMLGAGGPDRSPDERPVAVLWDEAGGGGWIPQHPDRYRLPDAVPGPEVYESYLDSMPITPWPGPIQPSARQQPCCWPPIARYQGDLIESTLLSEPIGRTGVTDLLYINFKAPDYAGHVWGMTGGAVGEMLHAVDQELARLVAELEARSPGDYVLFVTADHGQCPLPDSRGGVRLDPIQLESAIRREFGGLYQVVQSVVPHEVYLDTANLQDADADLEDVAAFLADYTYRQNVGPYVPADAVEQELLDRREFAAVFATSYLARVARQDVAGFGPGVYTGPGVDPGIPPAV
jgi:hypothetical protein